MFVGSALDGEGTRDTCPTNSGARVNTTGKEGLRLNKTCHAYACDFALSRSR